MPSLLFLPQLFRNLPFYQTSLYPIFLHSVLKNFFSLRIIIAQLLLCMSLLSACQSENTVEQEDSLYFFKPGKQYPYLLTAKDSTGRVFSNKSVVLFIDSTAAPIEATEGKEAAAGEAFYSLALAGHWQTDSMAAPIPAKVTADEHIYTLAFPPLFVSNFMAYTLPLEIDWVMAPTTQKNLLVSGLTDGKMHKGNSHSIRRSLQYVSDENLRIGKILYSKCRKMEALDESTVGKVKITYWVHPEKGFVQAIYRHALGERKYALQE